MDFLLNYGLDDMSSWMFADNFVERLRFNIDPNWYGELPASNFYNAAHQAKAHSGIMEEAKIRDLLSQ